MDETSFRRQKQPFSSGFQLSKCKRPWFLRVYKGLYYPAIWTVRGCFFLGSSGFQFVCVSIFFNFGGVTEIDFAGPSMMPFGNSEGFGSRI